MRRNAKGFTLMELMVVIVIVAILAAVAVPLYINYVKDATRTEAKGAIGAVITAEQTYFQRFGNYTTDAGLLNVDLSDLKGRWAMPPTIALTGVGTPNPGFDVTLDGDTGNNATKGLQVKCEYARGKDPKWSEL